jgi:REP-associated tyrosine transposase
MLPGIAIHAIQRANNRSACFASDEDRGFYLFHLDRILRRTGCKLHAYCLMSNHVHLLLTPEHVAACSSLMKGIGQLYSQYVNKLYKRSGHLWEGRFKSCLVQSEQYVLACYRYIELNPVRAELSKRADQYPWSSHRANAIGEHSDLLTPHHEYLRLGRTPEERQAIYRDLFSLVQGDDLERIRAATNAGYVLGEPPFRAMMARKLGRRVERGQAGRPSASGAVDGQLDLLPGN